MRVWFGNMNVLSEMIDIRNGFKMYQILCDDDVNSIIICDVLTQGRDCTHSIFRVLVAEYRARVLHRW